jgi:hypothetical protein
MDGSINMTKIETVTISLTRDMMDVIRKQSSAEYRSISKHIAYLIAVALKTQGETK